MDSLSAMVGWTRVVPCGGSMVCAEQAGPGGWEITGKESDMSAAYGGSVVGRNGETVWVRVVKAKAGEMQNQSSQSCSDARGGRGQ